MRKKLSLLLLLILIPTLCYAWGVMIVGGGVPAAGGGLAYDAASSDSNGYASSLSWAHTCTGSDRGLIIVVVSRSTSITHDSVTYNSVGLTKSWDAGNTSSRSTGWYYDGEPASGEHTVVVTYSDTTDIAAGAVSFTGVNTADPVDTSATATGYGTAATVDVSSASGDIVIDGVCHNASASVGADQTERWNVGKGASSTEDGAVTVTMSWTVDNHYWAIGGVSVNPK